MYVGNKMTYYRTVAFKDKTRKKKEDEIEKLKVKEREEHEHMKLDSGMNLPYQNILFCNTVQP